MSYFGSGQNPNHGMVRPGTPMQAPGGSIIQPQLFNQLQFGQADGSGFDHGAGGHIQLLQAPQQQQPPQSNFPLNFLTDQLMSQVSTQSPNLLGTMGLQGLAAGFTTVQQNIQQVSSTTQSSPSQQQPKQRVFTGTVTKVMDTFGFIDEDVFFQMNVVKGPVLPKAGDRVLVEADFNANMPFKWNATRVQIVNMAGNAAGGKSPGSSQPNTTATIPRSMPPPPILSNAGRHSNSANNHHPTSTSDHLNFNHGSIMSNPHFGQQHQTQNSSSGGGMYGQQTRGSPSQQQPPPRIGRVQPLHSQQEPLMPNPFHQSSSHSNPNPQSYQSSSKMDRDRDLDSGRDRERDLLDTINTIKDRDRGRERDRSRDVMRDRRSRSRSRSRSRDRNDSRRDDRRDRERRRSPVRSPPRRSSRDRDRRRERSRDRDDDRRRRDRSRDKEKSRSDVNKDSSDRRKESISISSPASYSSRKRSHSRDRDSRSGRDAPEKSSSRRTRSPSPRRKTFSSSKYAFDTPRVKLDTVDFDVVELKRRYRHAQIPQDLFMARSCWAKSFSMLNFQPVCLPSMASPVHIFRKHTDKVDLGIFFKEKNEAGELVSKVEKIYDVEEPGDANSIFSVKVLLLSMPEKQILFQKCCGLADDNAARFYLNKLISFIVGIKTTDKNEPAAIGGSWSASLDGENPQSDPQVLVNTARRTFKTFTGIDLQPCTAWFRFMELYYKRESGVLETVVYFLPDTSSCAPTAAQWTALTSAYSWVFHGDEKKEPQTPAEQQIEKASDDADADAVVNKNNSLKTSKDKSTATVTAKVEEASTKEKDGEEKAETEKDSDSKAKAALTSEGDTPSKDEGTTAPGDDAATKAGLEDPSAAVADGKEVAEFKIVASDGDVEMKDLQPGKEAETAETSAMDTSTTSVEASPRLSMADPKNMNVAKLKEELSARNLSTKGLKAQLLERLLEALEAENNSASAEPAAAVKEEAPTGSEPKITVKIEAPEEKDGKVVEDLKEKEESEAEMQNIQVLVPFTVNVDEKTKKSWERRYQLPSKPQMLIHPSNTAKDFDCTQLSLASLMDFTSTDSRPLKEPTFELSLFGHFFHEMLQYGFGLQIFRQLVVEAEKTEAEKPIKTERKPSVGEKEQKEKEDGGSDPKKPKLSTDEEAQAPVIITTVYPDLLFAFSYFDLSHGGTIQASDLEEVVFSLGVGLSRSEVLKMIQKVVSPKGILRYRDWTDKPTGKDGPLTEEENKALIDKLLNIIKGNRTLFPVFVYPDEENALAFTSASALKFEQGGSGSDGAVAGLLNRIKKYEQERSVQAATLNVTNNTLVQSKNQAAELKRSNESLNKELTRTKESLKKLDAESRSTRGNLETLKSALESYVSRVHHLIKLPAPAKGGSVGGSEGTASPRSTEDN